MAAKAVGIYACSLISVGLSPQLVMVVKAASLRAARQVRPIKPDCLKNFIANNDESGTLSRVLVSLLV